MARRDIPESRQNSDGQERGNPTGTASAMHGRPPNSQAFAEELYEEIERYRNELIAKLMDEARK